ncbi:hypothetical protein CSOJ01_14834 [Colletotrichum sojae]|uniref:Uncharacterized protein n=1 Tax=Colletotrichum sojae TaxID=2175907 RepID=A0A8H6MJD5_9PEZI|nr:hypothetical protein CSOJ01_14834 [Colletotrichum sojae]
MSSRLGFQQEAIRAIPFHHVLLRRRFLTMRRAVAKLAEFLSAVDLLTCTSRRRRLSTIWRCRGLQSSKNPPMRRTPPRRTTLHYCVALGCPASPDFDPRYPITALPFPRSALAGLIPGSFGDALRLCCSNLPVAVRRANTLRRCRRTTSPSDSGRAGVYGARLSDSRVTKDPSPEIRRTPVTTFPRVGLASVQSALLHLPPWLGPRPSLALVCFSRIASPPPGLFFPMGRQHWRDGDRFFAVPPDGGCLIRASLQTFGAPSRHSTGSPDHGFVVGLRSEGFFSSFSLLILGNSAAQRVKVQILSPLRIWAFHAEASSRGGVSTQTSSSSTVFCSFTGPLSEHEAAQPPGAQANPSPWHTTPRALTSYWEIRPIQPNNSLSSCHLPHGDKGSATRLDAFKRALPIAVLLAQVSEIQSIGQPAAAIGLALV